MSGPGKDYVIGKGRLYFDPFPAGTKTGTGERYFGNTPELTTTADAETLDHYDADEGLNVKDESITTENNLTGAFVTDNISLDNVALFFAGERDTVTVAPATDVAETVVAKKGRWFQLGTSEAMPMGARDITITAVTIDSVAVTPSGNLEYDLENGRVYIEPDAPGIVDDDELDFVYDVAASTREIVIGRGDEIRGALRFLSANPIGTKKNYLWPYVKLTPNGDFALKGSEWQQMGFNFEVLKKDSATERVYVEQVS